MIQEAQYGSDSGLVSELDLKQAQTLLGQVRSQRDAMHIQRAPLEHTIAELLGRTPEGFHTFKAGNRLLIPGLSDEMLDQFP